MQRLPYDWGASLFLQKQFQTNEANSVRANDLPNFTKILIRKYILSSIGLDNDPWFVISEPTKTNHEFSSADIL